MRRSTAALAATTLALAGAAPAAARTHYVVRYGDTLTAIARDHGVGLRRLARVNHRRVNGVSAPAPSSSSPAARSSATPRTYTVRWGDTLSGIGARFGIERRPAGAGEPALAARPAPGRRDAAPALRRARRRRRRVDRLGGSYVVRPGDTLSGIAARFGVGHAPAGAGERPARRGILLAGITLRVPAATRRRRARSALVGAGVDRRLVGALRRRRRARAGGRLAGIRLPHEHPLLGRGLGADAGAPGHVDVRRGRADRPLRSPHRRRRRPRRRRPAAPPDRRLRRQRGRWRSPPTTRASDRCARAACCPRRAGTSPTSWPCAGGSDPAPRLDRAADRERIAQLRLDLVERRVGVAADASSTLLKKQRAAAARTTSRISASERPRPRRRSISACVTAVASARPCPRPP